MSSDYLNDYLWNILIIGRMAIESSYLLQRLHSCGINKTDTRAVYDHRVHRPTHRKTALVHHHILSFHAHAQQSAFVSHNKSSC